jgi:hypothetical protein
LEQNLDANIMEYKGEEEKPLMNKSQSWILWIFWVDSEDGKLVECQMELPEVGSSMTWGSGVLMAGCLLHPRCCFVIHLPHRNTHTSYSHDYFAVNIYIQITKNIYMRTIPNNLPCCFAMSCLANSSRLKSACCMSSTHDEYERNAREEVLIFGELWYELHPQSLVIPDRV